MKNTKVKDLMTEHPVFVSADATLQEAAEKMKSIDCGVLPVGTPKQVEGMITDRDMVIRAIAKGKDPKTEKIAHYVSKHVYACNENDFIEDAADKMHSHKVSRLLVRNAQGDVSGILSFGCILRQDASAEDVANVVKHAIGTSFDEGCGVSSMKKQRA